MDPRTDHGPHTDGFRLEEEESDGVVNLRLHLVVEGVSFKNLIIHSVEDTVDGRAELSRVAALAESLATFLTYGGKPRQATGLAHAFAQVGSVSTPFRHVVTTVEAVRKHVLIGPDDVTYLITEGVSTEVLDKHETMRRLAEIEFERQRAEDPWAFLETLPMTLPRALPDGRKKRKRRTEQKALQSVS